MFVSFFGGNAYLKKSFQLFLTFSRVNIFSSLKLCRWANIKAVKLKVEKGKKISIAFSSSWPQCQCPILPIFSNMYVCTMGPKIPWSCILNFMHLRFHEILLEPAFYTEWQKKYRQSSTYAVFLRLWKPCKQKTVLLEEWFSTKTPKWDCQLLQSPLFFSNYSTVIHK